jgi:hypothetical protein
VEKGRSVGILGPYVLYIVYCSVSYLATIDYLLFLGRVGGRDVNLLMFCNQLVDLFSGNDA